MMDFIYLSSILFFAIIIDIFFKIILRKITKFGYDHFFHISLIKSIKENKHKFVNSLKFRLYEPNFAYPQFFHWLLSFLPIKFIEKKTHFIGVLINTISVVLFVFFSLYVSEYLNLTIDQRSFLFYTLVAFIFNPFSYATWNAKNMGISVRGFGLMLGYLYQYFIVMYMIENQYIFLILSIVVAFIILISSQFAFQFVVFGSPFFALFYKDILVLTPPFIAIILFLLTFPKLSIKYFKGQFYHKKNWAFHIAKVDILKQRPSIYRDFIYDFWKKKSFNYFINNPIMRIVLGFPFLSISVIWLFTTNRFDIFISQKYLYLLAVPVIVSLILFFITSFKYTRFLGEPERYVEFSLPFFSILSVYFLQKNIEVIVFGLIIASILLIYNFVIAALNYNKTFRISNYPELKQVVEDVAKNQEVRLFGNYVYMLNYFIDINNVKILFPNLTNNKTGGFTIKEIYPQELFKVNKKLIFPLIQKFGVNYFVLNKNFVQMEYFKSQAQNFGVSLVEIYKNKDYCLYSLKYKK